MSITSRIAALFSRQPFLKWEGPDADGDFFVTVVGVHRWKDIAVTGYGKSHATALHLLGDVLLTIGADDCEYCQALKGQCPIPPTGWRCTRWPGHDGPCAAVPDDRIDSEYGNQ